MDEQSKALVERTAQKTADMAVQQTLTSLGIDHNNPIEVQRDMASLRELRSIMDDPEFQADMLHIRKWRRSMEKVESKGLMTLVGLVTAGVCAALWVGFKDMIGK